MKKGSSDYPKSLSEKEGFQHRNSACKTYLVSDRSATIGNQGPVQKTWRVIIT